MELHYKNITNKHYVIQITLNYLHYFLQIPLTAVFCDLLQDSGRAHPQEGLYNLGVPSIVKYA